MDITKQIDTSGLNCPLPILRTKKALSDMQSGQILKVMATDPSALRDFEIFAEQTGHELVFKQHLDGVWVFCLCHR